jgi:mono/diheme cytochrome c family protein
MQLFARFRAAFRSTSTTTSRSPMSRSVVTRRGSALAVIALVAAGSIGALRTLPAAEARAPHGPPIHAQAADGKQVYSTTCAACHQAAGEGVEGTYPPLAGSEWVNGDDAKVVRIVLNGVSGPLEVAGETYSGMMPAWGPVLKDDDIAAVLTYVRSSWGNKAQPITAATVAKIRAATASRSTPWTAAELAKLK